MIARTDAHFGFRPRLVLAYADSMHAALSGRHLRRQSWEFNLASCGVEAHRLAAALGPKVVVLDAALRDESGWLTCAKLTAERPAQKVVLVAAEITPQVRDFAVFVGAAAVVPRDAGPAALVEEVLGAVLA